MLTCVYLLYLCLHGSKALSACDLDIPRTAGGMLADSEMTHATCTEGMYFNTDLQQCVVCPGGTFMTSHMAGKKLAACRKCSTPVQNEVIKSACTPTRDTEIMCAPGFYKVRDASDHCAFSCQACSVCGLGEQFYKNYEARPCLEASDTICCYDDNMDENCVDKKTTTTTTTTVRTTTMLQLLTANELPKAAHLRGFNSAQIAHRVNITRYLLICIVIITHRIM
ncbi:tumor necrosis factor receptor superfamily member 10B-like [Physella acuta]|uniref:tumor necrosis factor receptor superfamily member 10B-like n=1 Tax=Physella acuta TaxID=109671 RepID=UPI0027DDBA9D|nr:tumor necrosis factor receptor superfamily member 10B-like [Physella acuta]